MESQFINNNSEYKINETELEKLDLLFSNL